MHSPLPVAEAWVTLPPVFFFHYATALADYRMKAGMTQDDLAQAARLSRSQVQKMERGEKVTRRAWLDVIDALKANDRFKRTGLDADTLMPPDDALAGGPRTRDRRSPAQHLADAITIRNGMAYVVAKSRVPAETIQKLLDGGRTDRASVERLISVLFKEGEPVPAWTEELVEDGPSGVESSPFVFDAEMAAMLDKLATTNGLTRDEMFKKMMRDEFERQMQNATGDVPAKKAKGKK